MRAAQYVRMSTEHQQYSIENQQAVIAEYAERCGFEVVETYSDPARSGLTLAGRPGLRKLLEHVLSGAQTYDAVLVYDVSRWGRFQDVDESAYYEFLCKKAGVRVHYCAEPFDSNDGSTMAALFKSLKRAMAGEYLRELSEKVWAGQRRMADRGYKQGGSAGYGLRRLLIDQSGKIKGILEHGERKSVDSDRVIYVLGPLEEVQIVREIFDWWVNEELSAPQIAKRLNERGVSRAPYGKWAASIVLDLLHHPKYMGTMVYNRINKRLGVPEKQNPFDQWVLKIGCFPGIVSPQLFYAAQQRFIHPRDLSDRELLERLQRVLEKQGELSQDIIDAAPEVPSSYHYVRRLGSLGNAYTQLGYCANNRFVRGGQSANHLRHLRHTLGAQFVSALQALGTHASVDKNHLSVHLRVEGNGAYRVGVATVKKLRRREISWEVRIRGASAHSWLLVARLAEDSITILDYLLVQVPRAQGTIAINEKKACTARLGTRVEEAARALIHGRLSRSRG